MEENLIELFFYIKELFLITRSPSDFWPVTEKEFRESRNTTEFHLRFNKYPCTPILPSVSVL